mmetsp:Transcript_9538/g.19748  ORF Transcript_9538/g.19748 Transcript_9538/m.19748 type:complete len:149 (+) Transcript_9538:99-545(+)|eukprot:CAMPEP_0118945300 /NCGR_PEP_ID=MMETSP1169-20130426/41979_1 /TAXON_ID=36882 /ORGANISM="Pyramimonas obovata, Strain CCMP722" /LENGTH=148 /DNA_ID=CAMNT_0006890981 /DNA_START=90 /DNA_END=536 /DNA_ORIENTATION=+
MSREEAAAKLLGVPVGASREEVKEAYRKLALRTHPDRNRSDPAAFTRINDAYKILNAAPEARSDTYYTQTRQSHTFTSRAQYRPGNVKVLAGCGAMVLGGCVLFGGALWWHVNFLQSRYNRAPPWRRPVNDLYGHREKEAALSQQKGE